MYSISLTRLCLIFVQSATLPDLKVYDTYRLYSHYIHCAIPTLYKLFYSRCYIVDA